MQSVIDFSKYILTDIKQHPKTSWGKNELIEHLKQLYIEWLEHEATKK